MSTQLAASSATMKTPNAKDDQRKATQDEIETLPHVVDSIPAVVWVALVAGAAERFTFYAVSTPWQNYIQNSASHAGLPGALGLGQSVASTIGNAFYFFSSITPIPFAILSDARLGRYKTLCLSLFLNLAACLILFVTSLPVVESIPAKIGGLAASLLLLSLGTGGIKATVSPFIGDQYVETEPQVITCRDGTCAIADRQLTMQYIYNVFYWLTNVASLVSLVGATYLEKYIGFWAAYLLPLCSFWITIPILLLWNRRLVKVPTQGNILPQAGRVLGHAARHGFRLDAARPQFQRDRHGREVPWTDGFVSEIGRGLRAFKVMSCFVPFYLCLSQLSNNLISQAGQMRLGEGIPNDLIPGFNDIGCIALGPVIQGLLYPTLQRYKISFRPIARMAWAFVAVGAAMAYAAGLQKIIYSSGPCYNRPLACPESNNGRIPNNVSVWLQIPVYMLLSVGEILGFTTLSEYSYSEAPKDMRSLLQALRQVSAAVGSALALALAQASADPSILYVYTGLAAAMGVSAIAFWLVFRKYDGIPSRETEQSLTPASESDGDAKQDSQKKQEV